MADFLHERRDFDQLLAVVANDRALRPSRKIRGQCRPFEIRPVRLQAHEIRYRRPFKSPADADTGGTDATAKELKMAKKLDDIIAAMPAQRRARVEGRALELTKLKNLQHKRQPIAPKTPISDAPLGI